MTRRSLTPALFGALFLLICAFPVSAQYLRIYYPDIEQGSATLVVSPTGNALLVDAGTGIRASDEGIEDFINDLIDAGIVTSIDYLVATHYDEDHIGRMENVFQLVDLPPTVITYDRGEFIQVPSTFAYSDYAFGASQHNRTTVPPCSEHDLGGGASFRIWTVNGEVCNGPVVDVTGANQFENNVSVSLVVTFGDVDVWIGGDLTGNPDVGVADVETPTGMEVQDVDVYTVNHHGSETSSNAGFLADLAAEVAINQNSMINNFGHPRATVVERIKSTLSTSGQPPLFFQQNPGDPADTRSDDALADGIADCDDASAGDVFGLPGTVELVSDGTSYRIHACGIPATIFPADTGSGIAGPYPPAVRSVLHAPRVPLASEPVQVEVEIEDASDAELRYSLNGVPQASLPMSFVGGNTWSAAIPAQPDGVRVDFRVGASNANVNDELSRSSCYFSGTTPVSVLRDQDGQGVLNTKTCSARVEGVMTAEPGLFHEFVTIAYLQDASGGLQIFDRQIDPAIQRGDRVEWTGAIEQFGAQAELNVSEPFGNHGHVRLGADVLPQPQVLSVAQVGEASEGQLIRLNNVQVVSGSIPEAGSGNLTITDNGVDMLTLRVSETTDLPGANTPTGTFDVIGISSQFDSWVPFDSGYQILPRGKADVISDEVNFPQVIISEVLADPATGPAGDANGDGVRSATDDEFVELLNTGTSDVDISGWTISDAATPNSIRHVFPAGTIIPARDAVVVFGGGTPTGEFGTAGAEGRVFIASTGTLSLNNASGHSVTLADQADSIVQTVTYDSSALADQSIVRAPDFSNAPMQRHADLNEAGGALFSPGTRIGGAFFTIPQGVLLLSEVMYDPSGADSGLEWIELFNNSTQDLRLDDVCIGSGGNDYTNSIIALDGCGGGACVVPAGGTFVVGGPESDAANGSPIYDLIFQISPGMQNSGSVADGVALFNRRCAQVDAFTVPMDAVVYGADNSNGLIDASGTANPSVVDDAPSGQSIERTTLAGAWQIQSAPSPGLSSLGGAPVNNAPVVSIVSPADNAGFDVGESIQFSGAADDVEDGDLSAGLEWSSDIDGLIGFGASFSIDTLSAGSHLITAWVQDSGGLDDIATIEISISSGGAASVLVSEVLYDVTGSDDGYEWAELYNAGTAAVSLDGWCLANGGNDYTYSKSQLAGSIAPGGTYVVGGLNSSSVNAAPAFDLGQDFSPDFQNSGSAADGVALFSVACSEVDAATVPVDAVIYGGTNSSGLLDASGQPGPVHVGDADAGSSIERTTIVGDWQIQPLPNPNATGL